MSKKRRTKRKAGVTFFYDITIDLNGKTLEEAFANAAVATYEIMTRTKLIKPEVTQHIDLKAKKLRNLLYDFIQELIVLMDTDGFMMHKVKSIKISGSEEDGWELKAELRGDHYDKYDVHTPIKAMTYSDLLIEKRNESYMLQVVVDI